MQNIYLNIYNSMNYKINNNNKNLFQLLQTKPDINPTKLIKQNRTKKQNYHKIPANKH